ncbi:MAG: hypothetical protein ACF8AM_12015, partial [Rhodopirellula sp. JB055]
MILSTVRRRFSNLIVLAPWGLVSLVWLGNVSSGVAQTFKVDPVKKVSDMGAIPAYDVAESIDWPAFLEVCDWQRETMPRAWDEAPFTGNGEQGTLVYQLDDRTIQFDVGCSAAH